MNGHTTKIICGEEYHTSEKAAETLGISKSTLLCLCRAKQIAYLKIGKMLVFKPEWLKDFVSEKTNIGTYNEKRYISAMRKEAKKCAMT